ncbi:MAG: ChaB family protein [Chloroflexi bacterium]|nr:ChaB family protein [Chloroflexota bacterium]
MPGREDMPETIRRSDARARDIYVKTHDSAVEQYGEGERSHRTAFKALKREYRKQGDHWVKKDNRAPSDPQQAGNRSTHRMTAGGYDVGPGATLKTLRDEARDLGIRGRSHMAKEQLRQEIMDRAGRRV